MPRNNKWWLTLLHILLCGLSVCYGRMNVKTLIIYNYLNETEIPKEHKSLPLVGKCCPNGQILDNVTCVDSDSNDLSSFSHLCNASKDISNVEACNNNDKLIEMVAIVGMPNCTFNKILLSTDECKNKNSLLLNGSVSAPFEKLTMLKLGVDYCMEIYQIGSVNKGLNTIMCGPDPNKVQTKLVNFRYHVYAGGFLISVLFLIVTIAAYCINPQLRDDYGKTLCCHCACLAFAFFTLAITQLGKSHLPDQAYIGIAYVVQFSFIACLFWMNAMFIEMWLLVRSHVERMEPKTLFLWYCLWGWGLPLIHTFISWIIKLDPWIPISYVQTVYKTSSAALTFFCVPVGLLFLGNVILLVLTFITLSKYKDRDLRHCHTMTAIACLNIFSLMALNWSIELLRFVYLNNEIREGSIFDLIYTLQGVVVFYLFVIRRPKDFAWHRIQQARDMDTTQYEDISIEKLTVPEQTIIP